MNGRGEALPRLRVLSGPSAGAELPLPVPVGLTASIGRGAASDLVVADSDVSGTHAQIQVSHTGVVLSDAGSLNGTWVDGRPIA